MGYGLPAALGAKLACEDKTIINITGDGSILMNIQELMTCVAYGVPLVNIILNNKKTYRFKIQSYRIFWWCRF